MPLWPGALGQGLTGWLRRRRRLPSYQFSTIRKELYENAAKYLTTERTESTEDGGQRTGKEVKHIEPTLVTEREA